MLLIIEVASRWGALWTIAGCALTGLIGGALVRREGFRSWQQIQKQAQSGQLPAVEFVAAAMLFGVGALLLTPGFITDIAGFIGVIPSVRMYFARRLIARFSRPKQGGGVVVETEAWTKDD